MERYAEMVDFSVKLVAGSQELTDEERNMLSSAFKNVVGNKRAELRVLAAIEQ